MDSQEIRSLSGIQQVKVVVPQCKLLTVCNPPEAEISYNNIYPLEILLDSNPILIEGPFDNQRSNSQLVRTLTFIVLALL